MFRKEVSSYKGRENEEEDRCEKKEEDRGIGIWTTAEESQTASQPELFWHDCMNSPRPGAFPVQVYNPTNDVDLGFEDGDSRRTAPY